MNTDCFLSDSPVTLQQQDKFQRFNFSKRIADTIIANQREDSIVIGVYGRWGEGKTSSLNFINECLKGRKDILTMRFNPWRYNDETVLLKQFFKDLSNLLKTKLFKKGEEIGNIIDSYNHLLDFNVNYVGNISKRLKSIRKFIDKPSLKELKQRLDTALLGQSNKIVIFIDDIDSLDRNEIHSIFKLVKLTADFPKTTYILSFDEAMVSAAIGERFGNGAASDGKNFLEKIIQVPLKLPVCRPEAIREFCAVLINQTLDQNRINIEGEEAARFLHKFDNYIIPRLTTPRLAIRYNNSLSFLLPLLNGEVNVVDLMLIESVKVIYPEYYELIKNGVNKHFPLIFIIHLLIILLR